MLSEKIKNESMLIKELIEKNNNFKYYNKIEELSISVATFLSLVTAIISVLYSLSNQDMILSPFYGVMFFSTIFFAFAFILFFSLTLINYIIKGNIIKENKDTSNFFDLKYIIPRSKVIEFNNLYNKLSITGKRTFENFKCDKKETKIEEMHYFYLKEEINEISIKNFINYYKKEFESDIEELKINRDNIINEKILEILEYLDYSLFNEFKDSLIEITLTLKDKSKQLNIINKFEEIKKQYDKDIIDNEIINKLNNLNKKTSKHEIEKSNKILRSI